MGLPSLWECASGLEKAGPLLLDWALRSCAVMAATGVIATAMWRASAAARHWVWMLGFAGMLVVPLLSMVLPGWHVLPAVGTEQPPQTIVTITAPDELEPLTQPRSIMNSAAAIDKSAPAVPTPGATNATLMPAETGAVSAAPSSAPLEQRPLAAPAQPTTRRVNSPTAAISAPTLRRELPWPFWLALAWVSGSVLIAGYTLLGYASLRLLRRRCRVMTQKAWVETLDELKAELGIRRKVELLSTSARTMPMTWGIWRTRILVPEQASEWPIAQRRSVLLHELAHVRRRDCATQLIAQIVCVIYWFNPLVWIAWRRMQIERERACDNLVLATGAKASAYARHLLESALAGPAAKFTRAAALAMARPSTLEERLREILDSGRNRQKMSRTMGVVAILLLLMTLLPAAILRAQERTPVMAPAAAVATSNPTNDTPVIQPVPSPASAAAVAVDIPANDDYALNATIYEVRLPPDSFGRLDVEALRKAAVDAAEFDKALAALGIVKPMYQVQRQVKLSADQVQMSTNTPYVASSRMSANGTAINQVSYVQTGVTLDLAGKVVQGGKINLDMAISISSATEGSVKVSTEASAMIMRRPRLLHNGLLEPGKAFVVMSIDGSTPDADGKAIGYIARVELNMPTAGQDAPGK